MARRILFHPPSCSEQLAPGRYVEPLNDARTPLADFFSILLGCRWGIAETCHGGFLGQTEFAALLGW
jgi:hypothetical protein